MVHFDKLIILVYIAGCCLNFSFNRRVHWSPTVNSPIFPCSTLLSLEVGQMKTCLMLSNFMPSPAHGTRWCLSGRIFNLCVLPEDGQEIIVWSARSLDHVVDLFTGNIIQGTTCKDGQEIIVWSARSLDHVVDLFTGNIRSCCQEIIVLPVLLYLFTNLYRVRHVKVRRLCVVCPFIGDLLLVLCGLPVRRLLCGLPVRWTSSLVICYDM